jgi:hypothetical protein
MDFEDGAAVVAWIPASCSTILQSISAGLSVPIVPAGAIDSGDILNSVGGVPVALRPRIAGFSWLGCGFALDSRLLLKHPAVLFGQPFGAECPWG